MKIINLKVFQKLLIIQNKEIHPKKILKKIDIYIVQKIQLIIIIYI